MAPACSSCKDIRSRIAPYPTYPQHQEYNLDFSQDQLVGLEDHLKFLHDLAVIDIQCIYANIGSDCKAARGRPKVDWVMIGCVAFDLFIQAMRCKPTM